MSTAKQFIKNGLLLACTSVFLRGASVAFNVYVTKRIGAEGIGLYGLIMSVYMLVTTVATSGAGLATTRLTAEELSSHSPAGIRKTVAFALLYALFFGILSFILLAAFAPYIGSGWLSDVRTVRSLYALAISLPFIAISSVLSGYFLAVRRVSKNAFVQVFELLIKVLATVYGLHLFIDRGIAFACFALVAGGSFAEIASCSLICILYRIDVRRFTAKSLSVNSVAIRFLYVSLPVAISAYLRSGLVSLEHILIPVGLKKFGASASASLAQYGVVHGMVMPVLLFPSAIVTAFSGLLVPELTELQTRHSQTGIDRVVGKVFRTALLFSIGACTVFFAFADPLGIVLYKSTDASLFIRFLAPLCIVMYMDSVTDSMLKGLNQQVSSMRYNIFDSLLSVALIYLLLPRFGINSYVAIIFITELLNAFLSMNRLISITNFSLSVIRDIMTPALSACVSFLLVHGIQMQMNLNFTHAPTLCLCIALFSGCYLLLLFALKELSIKLSPSHIA